MNRTILLIAGGVLAVVLIGIGIVTTKHTSKPVASTITMVYDDFLGFNMPADQPRDPSRFYIYGSQQLDTYFNSQTSQYIVSTLGEYAQTSIDEKIFRAKMTPDPIVAPGDLTVSFKIIYDSSDKGIYTVKITQVPQQVEFASFTITDAHGVTTSLIGD